MKNKKERKKEWRIMEKFTYEWIYLVSILAVVVLIMIMLKDVV